MTAFNLNGRYFSPAQNSDHGRVGEETLFLFEQTDDRNTATYAGGGVTDGHIIGRMTGPETAELIYHSRSAAGTLEAGQAKVHIAKDTDELITLSMNWQWMNRDQESGTSFYKERPA